MLAQRSKVVAAFQPPVDDHLAQLRDGVAVDDALAALALVFEEVGVDGQDADEPRSARIGQADWTMGAPRAETEVTPCTDADAAETAEDDRLARSAPRGCPAGCPWCTAGTVRGLASPITVAVASSSAMP